MISRMRTIGVAAGLALSLAASGLAAQSAQKASVQVSALGASLGGQEFTGWGTGSGFEAQIRYNPSSLSIGGGFQLTKHSLEGFDSKVNLGGVFVEPRYIIPTKSNKVAPYVALRLSLLRESGTFDAQAGKVTVAASGFTFNGGGGVLFRLAKTLNLDLGATWGKTNFGKVTTKLNGTVVPQASGIDAGSGTNFVFRAGLALGLGK